MSDGDSNVTTRSPVDLLALSEVLKLLFNITHHFPALVPYFKTSVSPMLKMLVRQPAQYPILQPPTTLLLNALMNLNLDERSLRPFYNGDQPVTSVEHLMDILESAINDQNAASMATTTAPITSLLRSVYQYAPQDIQARMRDRLLPTDQDRNKPLGQGSSLAAQLLRISTSAVSVNVKEPLSCFLFELSQEDPAIFVQNVGFGFAAGFLHNHNIPMPSNMSSDGHRQGFGSDPSRQSVNFVTGQNLADEPQVQLPEMTEDEKMREAEKLFVLFERFVGRQMVGCPIGMLTWSRLKATGVVDVENPVREAVQSGRFEELDD